MASEAVVSVQKEGRESNFLLDRHENPKGGEMPLGPKRLLKRKLCNFWNKALDLGWKIAVTYLISCKEREWNNYFITFHLILKSWLL